MENQTIFNDKELCPYGELFRDGMLRAFICTKDSSKRPCGFCRYCRTNECFKMLYSSLRCPLKDK